MDSEGRYIAVDDNKESLEHYGVLGMKWGVRTDGKPRGFQYGKNGSGKKSKLAKKEAAAKKTNERLRKEALSSHDPEVVARGMHLLTDEELGMKIKRLSEEHKIDNIRYENKQRQLSIAQQSKRGKNIAEKYSDAVVNQIVNEAATSTVRTGKALGGLGFNYARTIAGNPNALDGLTPEKFAGDFARQLDWENMSAKDRSKIAAKRWSS